MLALLAVATHHVITWLVIGLIAGSGVTGVIQDTLVAFVGAVILLALVRLLTPPTGRRRSARGRVSRR